MWTEELRFLEEMQEATAQSLNGVIGARAAADQTRLVYCDYLDELGDVRGAYLRTELSFAESLRNDHGMERLASELGQLLVQIYRKQITSLDMIVLRRWLKRVSIPFHVVVTSYGSYQAHVIRAILQFSDTDWFAVQRELHGAQQLPVIRNADWSNAWNAVKKIRHPVEELGEGLELADAPTARLIRADCKLTN